jgi:hypothetical protein
MQEIELDKTHRLRTKSVDLDLCFTWGDRSLAWGD